MRPRRSWCRAGGVDVGDLVTQDLRHFLASNAVRTEGGVEVLYHTGPHVSCAEDPAVLDSLDGLGNSPEDPELVTSIGELRALQVLHLEAEISDQIIVHEGGAGYRQLAGGQHREGSPLDGKHKFLLIRIFIAERDKFLTTSHFNL